MTSLEAIKAGKDTALKPAESVSRFDHPSMTLLCLGVNRRSAGSRRSPWAEGILAEMLAEYPETIARRRSEGHEPMLPSLFFAEVYRNAPRNPSCFDRGR